MKLEGLARLRAEEIYDWLGLDWNFEKDIEAGRLYLVVDEYGREYVWHHNAEDNTNTVMCISDGDMFVPEESALTFRAVAL